MIERARSKREWEKTLPTIVDESSKEERVRMMEEQDAMEWKWREEEIEEIQKARLQKLEQYFVERDDENINKVNAKLESVLAKQEQRKATRDFKRQREGLKVLRRLVQKRANPEKKLMRRNIIDDYSDPGSEVFAKTAREGTFTVDDDANRNVVTSDYINTYRGLLELESWLPETITTPRVVAPPKRPRVIGVKQHDKDRYRNKLESLAMQIKVDKGAPQEAPPLRFLERIPPPPKRPAVPRVAIPEAGTDEREQALIFIQRLLRGRCEQASMFEGKELRRDLIAEVRTTHALEDDEAKEKAQEHRNINDARQKASDAEDRTNTDAAIVGNVAGGTVGRTLDFLSKELVRLQEERRVHAFAMLAEKQRRIREAEESGKRQREEALRAKQNEIFRQIAGVHHTSVETYLEDILIDSTTHVADEIARTEIRRKAAAIDMVAQQLHDEGKDETEMGALAIAADLVSSFLLPEADRVVVRQKVKQRQRRFLVAAHRELIAGETEAESKVEPRERFSTISPLTSTEVDTVMEENEEDEHAFLRDASNTTKGEDATPTEPEAKVAVAVAVAVAEGEAGEAATTPVAEDGVDKPTDAATEDAAEKPTKPAAEDSAGGADKAAEPVAEGDVENPTTPAADAAEPTEPTEPAAEDAADKPTTPAADAAEPTEPTQPAAEATEEIA